MLKEMRSIYIYMHWHENFSNIFWVLMGYKTTYDMIPIYVKKQNTNFHFLKYYF